MCCKVAISVSKVGRVMAATYDEVKAIHINFCIMKDPQLAPPDQQRIPAIEKEGLMRSKGFERMNSAYATERATKPATIGLVVSSSPIALLAWIFEKFLDWTDEDPPIETIFEAVSLYWLTNCASTCIYPYRQASTGKGRAQSASSTDYRVKLFTPGEVKANEHPPWHINKLLGYSLFPKELAPIPQTWAAKPGDLVFYRQYTSSLCGDKETEELWTDVQDFIRQVWK